VPSVSHLGPIHLGLDVHKDTISVAILAPIVTAPTSTGFLMTRRRYAGSLAAWVLPAGCEPAMRPARPGSSWPGCWTACRCAARWSRRR
jgi:hypothetical protein